MRLEFMPIHPNVVRFPLERRVAPSLSLVRQIAPDPREVAVVAEVFGLPPVTTAWRQDADAAMAARLRRQTLPVEPEARRLALGRLLRPLVVRAVQACVRAEQVLGAAVEAQQRHLETEQAGFLYARSLRVAADAWAVAGVHAFVAAFRRSEEAEGAARAIGLARRGEVWRPSDRQAEAEELFFGSGRSLA